MTRTERDNERRERALAEARRLEDAVQRAVQADYPGLHGYLLRLPTSRIIRTGSGEDDWRWGGGRYGGYRSAADQARALERFAGRVVQVAAARISEAYGLGAGSEWATRHFACAGDESVAEAQVRTSLQAIRRAR